MFNALGQSAIYIWQPYSGHKSSTIDMKKYKIYISSGNRFAKSPIVRVSSHLCFTIFREKNPPKRYRNIGDCENAPLESLLA